MNAEDLIKIFKRKKLGPYIEVPCSLLSSLIRGLESDPHCEVLNPVNEAVAMGIAAGTYLATGKIPVVLMQNSGLCNTLNALTSLNQIYKLPALYIITWRGYPKEKDAPEHLILGSKLEQILKSFDIPYAVLSETGYRHQISRIVAGIKKSGAPAALIVKARIIDGPAHGTGAKQPEDKILGDPMTRSEVIQKIFTVFKNKACYVTTNGFISRDAFHAIVAQAGQHWPVFYMLGSMGHALPLGLGLSFSSKKEKRPVVVDGDGGALMHLGAMASVAGVGAKSRRGLVYLVLDNHAYASTGGQPTVSAGLNFCGIARSCGFDHVFKVTKRSDLETSLRQASKLKGFIFIHVTIEEATNCPSPRVSSQFSCEGIKKNFMKNLGAGV
jgi:phosphonopyruvate decarboxylase